MRIGIVGAENSHTLHIAKLMNVEKVIPDCTVECVWGETPEFAQKAAEGGEISRIVDSPEEMLGFVDAVVVDHRHAKYHLPAARPFVERGLPVFVDKPFCYRSTEGKEFLEFARKCGAPITSFSILPHQTSFINFCEALPSVGEVKAAMSYGPCDLESEWGGVFFYGIHQVDVVLTAFGYDVASVQIINNGDNASGLLFYPSGLTVNMALIKQGSPGFGVGAVGDQGSHFAPLPMDESQYLRGVENFAEMFRTGKEPLGYHTFMKPVQVLEALERSVASGREEPVED
jgi:predicted dehydrogenase